MTPFADTLTQKALERLAAAGGVPYFVGGAARDWMLTGDTPKDLDVEIFGLQKDELVEVLSEFGEVHQIGASYGVFSLSELRFQGLPVEFSIPRSRESYAQTHKDAEVELDPHMSFREASMRRDLTVNSMGIRFPDGAVMDYWGGQRDWKTKSARPVNPDTFPDDHLRVLRAAQFCARWGLKPHGMLTDLSSTMTQEYLPPERVHTEWHKLLMKGKSISAGLNFLLACGWLRRFYPELYQLTNIHQSPKHHPEGTVWDHTCEVINWAVVYKNDVPEDRHESYMYACLVHDVGKIEYTKWIDDKQDWQSGGHVASMLPLTVLDQITAKTRLKKRAMWLVKHHDRRIGLETAKPGRFRALASKILDHDPDMWLPLQHVWRADTMPFRIDRCNAVIGKVNEAMEEVQKEPLPITGADIISMGVKRGPDIGKWLKRAQEIHNEEPLDREQLLQKLEEEIE